MLCHSFSAQHNATNNHQERGNCGKGFKVSGWRSGSYEGPSIVGYHHYSIPSGIYWKRVLFDTNP